MNFYDMSSAYKKRPSRMEIVEGMLSIPSLSVVYGPPGNLKSMLMLYMAIYVAAGEPVFDTSDPPGAHKPRNTTQVPVMWMDWQNGKRICAERMEAIGESIGRPIDIPFCYTSMAPRLDISDEDEVNCLMDILLGNKIKLLVIDNMGAMLGKTEDSSSKMCEVMRTFRGISDDLGAAVVLLHYCAKRNNLEVRGHRCIDDMADLTLHIIKTEDTVSIHSTKARGMDILPFDVRFMYNYREFARPMEVPQLESVWFEYVA